MASTAELSKSIGDTIIIGDEGRSGIQEGIRVWLKGVQQVKYYAMNFYKRPKIIRSFSFLEVFIASGSSCINRFSITSTISHFGRSLIPD